MIVRELDGGDRAWLRRLVDQEWGLPVVSPSGPHDPSTLPGFVAEEDGRRVGALTYRTGDGECEVVTLNALEPGRGVGTALLQAAREMAARAGARLWLITTNDNIDAIAFYQRRGMDMRALHRDFVEVVRAHKPQLDDHARGPIRFRHAIEFSY